MSHNLFVFQFINLFVTSASRSSLAARWLHNATPATNHVENDKLSTAWLEAFIIYFAEFRYQVAAAHWVATMLPVADEGLSIA